MTALLLAATTCFLPSAPVPGEKTSLIALPYILELRAGESGTPLIKVHRTAKKNTIRFNIERDQNGESVYREIIVEIEYLQATVVELRELQELRAFTADGKELKPETAIEKIGSGAIVLVSSDGRKLDAAVSKIFKDDVIVLCSSDLVPKFDEDSIEVVLASPASAKNPDPNKKKSP